MPTAAPTLASPALIERHEAKYRIPPKWVAPIREALRGWCVPDEAGDGAYTIASLYLDSPDRRLYFETVDRAPRRFKLRVRRYASGPLHLEIKRRLDGMTAKSRAAIPAAAWPGVLHDPRLLDTLPAEAREVAATFRHHCLTLDAEPAALVRYAREAWVSTVDTYARVTFDSHLEGRRPEGWAVPFADDRARWLPVDHPGRFGLKRSGVVLELKCEVAVPGWMRDLVRHFRLERSSFSKYATALDAVDGLRAPSVLLPVRRLR